MTKYSFSKTTVTNISKFLLDKSFFYFIAVTLFIFSTIKNIFTFYSWSNNFLTYFPKDVIASKVPSLNFIDFIILVFINFIAYLIPAFIIRFCIGVIFIKSQIKVQRFLSILILFVFIFSTNFSGYFFGKESKIPLFLINISEIINICFLGFFIISIMLFFVNINDNLFKRRIRITLLFIGIILFLLYDWKKTENFRAYVNENINKNHLLFIIETTDSENFDSITSTDEYKYLQENFVVSTKEILLVSNKKTANYIAMFTGLYPFESGIRNDIPSTSYFKPVLEHIKLNKNTEKEINISNISNPTSYATIISQFNKGIHCSNNISKLKIYNYLQNLNPITLFLPTTVLMQLIPDTLCLNSFKNLNEVILDEIYLRITQNTIKERQIVTIIPEKLQPIDVFKIIEKINETVDSNQLNISLLFMQKQNKSNFIHLTKNPSANYNFNNIIEYGQLYFNHYSSDYNFDYFEESDTHQESKNAEVIEDRLTLTFSESIKQIFNLKRKYICLTKENTKETILFTKTSNKIPQTITISESSNTSTCKDKVKKSITLDLNLYINEKIFDKIYFFSTGKL